MATVLEKEKQSEKMSGAGSPVTETPKNNRKPMLFGILGILLVVAVVMGIRFMTWSSSHASTDDAFDYGGCRQYCAPSFGHSFEGRGERK